jgi:hypothetical protein
MRGTTMKKKTLITTIIGAIVIIGAMGIGYKMLHHPKIQSIGAELSNNPNVIQFNCGNKEEITKTGIIYIGDQHIQELLYTLQNENAETEHNAYIINTSNNKEDKQYFYEYAMHNIKDTILEKPQYNKWKIVINLGITDLNNMDDYTISMLNLLINTEWKNYDVYITSIGPVETDKMQGDKITNEQIEEFNKTIQDKFPKAHYIDTFHQILESYDTKDGVLYDNDTNIEIYNYILKNLFL